MQKSRRRARPGARILSLQVTLKGCRPAIWRRLDVCDDMTLGDLHYTLQIAMGWENCHLHEFKIGRKSYGDPWDEDPVNIPMLQEEDYLLGAVLGRVKARALYIYDFGDGWQHEMTVEQILAPDSTVRYPCCIAGEGACPPEDCGGPWGYSELVKAIQDPTHPNHEDMKDWMPGGVDPDAFDIATVNERFDQMGRWRALAEGDIR